MKTLRFKTNIKCGNCVATVTPYLNAIPEIEKWEVDTASPEKTLTVSGAMPDAPPIQQALQQAGYKAELVE